jgi:hypothetical protein
VERGVGAPCRLYYSYRLRTLGVHLTFAFVLQVYSYRLNLACLCGTQIGCYFLLLVRSIAAAWFEAHLGVGGEASRELWLLPLLWLERCWLFKHSRHVVNRGGPAGRDLNTYRGR